MIPEIIRSYELVLDEACGLLADVSDEQMACQPAAINHPAWIIGHLVYSCQMIGGELSIEPWLPQWWIERFATGSQPVGDGAAYPSKAELLEALHDGQRRIVSKLLAMREEDLDVPLPDENCRAVLPTLGQAVLHILTVHTAYHVGQISTWRRLMGLPRMPSDRI